MKLIRAVLGLLTACSLLLSGCTVPENAPNDILPPQTSPSSELPRQSARENFLLPYDPEGGMNPYTTKAQQNFYLCGLLYDSLATLSPTYEAENRLAEEIVLEGVSCTVQLRSDAQFWDGSPVTAADAAYSLALAMQSGYYGAGLTGVVSFTADPVDSRRLNIQLAQPDRFFANSLVFPIIKAETGEQPLPIGSGRYTPYLDTQELRPNANHFSKNTGKPFQLVEITDNDALNYGIKIGTIDYLFSDMRASWNKSYGSGYRIVQLNNMVYLGLNGNSGPMTSQGLRQVFYEVLQRQNVADKVYMGFGVPAYLPVNPSFGQAPYATPTAVSTLELLGDKLSEMGYENRDAYGYRIDQYNRRLSLRLLLNSETAYKDELSRLLMQACDQLGIEVRTQRTNFTEYQQKLAEGSYDLYIGEVKLPYNMDSTAMLAGSGQTGNGVVTTPELRQAYGAFREDSAGFEGFRQLFEEEVPFIPLLFRRGVVLFSPNFSSNIVATEQDIFYNIHEW